MTRKPSTAEQLEKYGCTREELADHLQREQRIRRDAEDRQRRIERRRSRRGSDGPYALAPDTRNSTDCYAR